MFSLDDDMKELSVDLGMHQTSVGKDSLGSGPTARSEDGGGHCAKGRDREAPKDCIRAHYSNSLKSRLEKLKQASINRHRRPSLLFHFQGGKPEHNKLEPVSFQDRGWQEPQYCSKMLQDISGINEDSYDKSSDNSGGEIDERGSEEQTENEDVTPEVRSCEEALHILSICCKEHKHPVSSKNQLTVFSSEHEKILDVGGKIPRLIRLRAIHRLSDVPRELKELWLSYKHMRAEMTFHDFNSKRRANSFIKEDSTSTLPPWLPSNAGTSKHKTIVHSKSNLKALSKHAMRVSASTSEKQSKTLKAMLLRLTLKIAFDTWRSTSQRCICRRDWINRCERVSKMRLMHCAYNVWKNIALPSDLCRSKILESEKKLRFFDRKLCVAHHFILWKRWTSSGKWYRNQTLQTAYSQWRCILLTRRQYDLLSTTASLWRHRILTSRMFSRWRRIACRRISQKKALISASKLIRPSNSSCKNPIVGSIDEVGKYKKQQFRKLQTELRILYDTLSAIRNKIRWSFGEELTTSDSILVPEDSFSHSYNPWLYACTKSDTCGLDEIHIDNIAKEIFSCRKSIQILECEIDEMQRRLEGERSNLEQAQILYMDAKASLDNSDDAMRKIRHQVEISKEKLELAQKEYSILIEKLESHELWLQKCSELHEEARKRMLMSQNQYSKTLENIESAPRRISFWKEKVISLAEELRTCSRGKKSVVSAKLQEARSILENEVVAAENAESRLGEDKKACDLGMESFYTSKAALQEAEESLSHVLKEYELKYYDLATLKEERDRLEQDLEKSLQNAEASQTKVHEAIESRNLLEQAIENSEVQIINLYNQLSHIRGQKSKLEDQHAAVISVVLENRMYPEQPVSNEYPEPMDPTPILNLPPVPRDLYEERRSHEILYDVCALNNTETDSDDDIQNISFCGGSMPLTSVEQAQHNAFNLVDAVVYFRNCRLARSVLFAFYKERERLQKAKSISCQNYYLKIMIPAICAWRAITEDAVVRDVEFEERFICSKTLRCWWHYSKKLSWMQKSLADLLVKRQGKIKGDCFEALANYCSYQVWKRKNIEVLKWYRLTILLRHWQTSTRRKVVYRLTVMNYQKTLDSNRKSRFFKEWRNASQNRKLLRRVFSQAVSFWSIKASPAALFEEQFQILRGCFNSWERFMHFKRQELHYSNLEVTAKLHYERTLLAVGLSGFKLLLKRAEIERAFAPLLHSIMYSWRITTYIRQRKPAEVFILRRAFNSWRHWVEERAISKSYFVIRWKVDGLMQRVFKAWLDHHTRMKKWSVRRDMAHGLLAHSPTNRLKRNQEGKKFNTGSKETERNDDYLVDKISGSLDLKSRTTASSLDDTSENSNNKHSSTATSSFSCAASSWRSYAEDWRTCSTFYRNAKGSL